MKPDTPTSVRTVRTRVAVSIAVASIALNVALLGKIYFTGERSAGTSADRAHGVETEGIPGGRDAQTVRTQPRAQSHAAPRPGYSQPGGETERWPKRTIREPWSVERPEPDDARGSREGAIPANRFPAPAPPAAPAPRAPAAVPLVAPDSRAGTPGTPSTGLPTRPEQVPEEDPPSSSTEPTVEVDPESDRTSPTVQSFAFDPPEVNDGGVTNLFIQASDDLSGVHVVWGQLRSPSGAASLQFGPQELRDSGLMPFTILIPRDAETGVWYVSTLSLTDRAGNSAVQPFTAATVPPGGTVRVVSSASDSTAPEVLQVWVEKPTLDGGEKNLVRIEATDDRSGVATITGYFQSAAKSAQIWFDCRSNTDSGPWEGDVKVPMNADCGEWTLQLLKVVDKAGNIVFLHGDSPILAGGRFLVSGGSDCDSSAPTLEAFDLSPALVSNETATEIEVTATVRDDGTGAVSMSGWFVGPVSTSGQAPRNYFSCTPNRSDPEAPWTGKILVPQYAPKGTWKVGLIHLQDKARNFRQYTSADPVVAGSAFEVE